MALGKTTRNADYIRQQQIKKPGVATITIRVTPKYQVWWDKPHITGMTTKN